MEQSYKRVDDINEKVKDASLPYLEWKVLFLVGEKSDVDEISSLLKDESASVADILSSLETKDLIEKVADVAEEMPAEEVAEEAQAPSIGDELLVDEGEAISQAGEEVSVGQDVSMAEDLGTEEKAEEEPVQVEETIKAEVAEEEKAEPEVVKEEEVSEQPEDFNLDLETDLSGAVEEPQAEVTADVPEPEPQVDEPAASSDTDEEIITDGSKKTIMVIDDSIVIRKMIEIALEEEDYKIVTAISGKEGLESIDKINPNLVILDMMLPDMNGIDVLKTIKDDKKLPVIMLSGKDSPQLIESAKEVGVDDFLPKPFRDEELVEKVKTLVGV